MKSSYEIEKEMEEKFGKDFINKIKRNKEDFEKLQKQLEDAKSFEEKVQNKQEKLRKDFIYISDNYTMYPDEICSNKLYQLAKKLVENNSNKEEEKEIIKQYEEEVIEEIQADIDLLQEELNRLKK